MQIQENRASKAKAEREKLDLAVASLEEQFAKEKEAFATVSQAEALENAALSRFRAKVGKVIAVEQPMDIDENEAGTLADT